MNNQKEIFVYLDVLSNGPQLIGTLFSNRANGKESFSFEYDREWLSNINKQLFFDPDLSFYPGRQYLLSEKNIFGIFSDSCPDRWGRLLMKRKEANEARKEARKPKQLNESDYLLGVYDEARMGALRFKTEKDANFLSFDAELSTPPWTTLRELEAATIAFESDDILLEEKWLKQLLAPGSSLGGARPKANVIDTEGSLWIAKFPSQHDENNSGAWEMVVHDLAKLCRLDVPEAKLETFSKYGSTFLVKRFDRLCKQRIHFTSAMTLLGKIDGEDNTSYLDLAGFIKSYGAYPKQDLIELWKRIVFYIAVSNTDDHLRNHGFLLASNGWKLSPLYDVNANIYGEYLSLSINDNDSSLDFNLALETANIYGINKKEANQIIDEIKNIVSNKWEELAKQYKISRSAIEKMRPAFHMNYE